MLAVNSLCLHLRCCKRASVSGRPLHRAASSFSPTHKLWYRFYVSVSFTVGAVLNVAHHSRREGWLLETSSLGPSCLRWTVNGLYDGQRNVNKCLSYVSSIQHSMGNVIIWALLPVVDWNLVGLIYEASYSKVRTEWRTTGSRKSKKKKKNGWPWVS